jgi:hypothetical protein
MIITHTIVYGGRAISLQRRTLTTIDWVRSVSVEIEFIENPSFHFPFVVLWECLEFMANGKWKWKLYNAALRPVRRL